MRGSRGSEMTDANRRLAMLWGDDDLISNPVGSTYSQDKQIQTTVADQLADENSLYRYYCRLLTIRHKYPAIAHGVYTAVDCGEKNFGGFLVQYEGNTIGIFHNTSTEEMVIDLSRFEGCGFAELLDAIGTGSAKLSGTMLTIGAQTSVILGEK